MVNVQRSPAAAGSAPQRLFITSRLERLLRPMPEWLQHDVRALDVENYVEYCSAARLINANTKSSLRGQRWDVLYITTYRIIRLYAVEWHALYATLGHAPRRVCRNTYACTPTYTHYQTIYVPAHVDSTSFR